MLSNSSAASETSADQKNDSNAQDQGVVDRNAQDRTVLNQSLQAKILIVDDSYMVAEMLSSFLGKQGCTISYALDGVGALELVKQNPPDLIIADWVMPNLDGLELCRRLRQSPELSWVYYIIMTAREGNDSMDRALEAGADEFLSKPFQAAELMTRVRAGLRIVELRRQQRSPQLSKPLTSSTVVGNRQQLAALLPQRIAQSRAHQEPLSLFVLRLANLTQLNKRLSREHAQELLQQFTNRLSLNVRDSDDLFCYDDGQFIVILPGTTLTAAQLTAERCSQRMVQQPFILQGQSPEVQIQTGTSALMPEDETQGMGLLRRAAQALRESIKQPGSVVTSSTAPLTEADPDLQEQVRSLQAQNLELRSRVALMAQMEKENRYLKQQMQHLTAQLQAATAAAKSDE